MYRFVCRLLTVLAVDVHFRVPLVVVEAVWAVARPLVLRADAAVHAQHVVEVADAGRAAARKLVDDPALLALAVVRLCKTDHMTMFIVLTCTVMKIQASLQTCDVILHAGSVTTFLIHTVVNLLAVLTSVRVLAVAIRSLAEPCADDKPQLHVHVGSLSSVAGVNWEGATHGQWPPL